MAEALEALRQQTRKTALQQLGLSAREPRAFAAELQSLGLEAEILALPYFDGVTQALQDPITGQPYFMAGVDGVGGTAPIGAP